MGAKITIGPAGNTFVIDSNAKFEIERKNNYVGNGKVESQDVFIEIEGFLTSKPVNTLWDDIVLVDEEVKNLVARRVQIELVGSGVKWDFQPGLLYRSPRLTRFRAIAEDGTASSRWTFQLSIHVIAFGNVGNGDNVRELQTSITEVKVNDQITRKIWRVNVVAVDTAGALGIALSFKPDEVNVQEEIERFFQENRVNAVWVWERRLTAKIREYEESIELVGSVAVYVEQTRIGSTINPPNAVLHRAPNPAQRVVLRGVVRGYVDKLDPPAPHWSEDADMKRQTGLEKISFTVIEDQDRGLYKREYQEVWIATNGVPNPNHTDHKVIKFLDPPSDGKAATL